MPPVLSLVVAYTTNRAIGRDNSLPWRLPGDLAHFKRSTINRPILMGRHTWESLGRPLPGRQNIVLSRNKQYEAKGAEVVDSLPAAIEAAGSATEICVIGGAQVYAQVLPLAHRIIATEIHAEVQGDAFFPPLPSTWVEISRDPQPEENGMRYDFVVYERQG